MIRDRTAPPDLVRQLREIVPNTDLIYLGEGRWQLGRYKTENSRERERIARASIGHCLEGPESLERARQIEFLRFVAATGFRPMGEAFEANAPETAGIRETLRRWRWTYLHRRDEAWEERVDAVSDERELEKVGDAMRDKIESEGRSIFKHVTSPTLYPTL